MPYSGERSGKTGHASFVRNPDISHFLAQCSYIRTPSDDEGKSIADSFLPAPKGGTLPSRLIACDASTYSEAFDHRFPHTQIGYVKVSLVLVDLSHYADLFPQCSRFVDPYKVAEMHRNANAITFTLPGSNICYGNTTSVAEGFRLAVFDQFADERTNFVKDGNYTLLDTLVAICGKVSFEGCPSCKEGKGLRFEFSPQVKRCLCPHCKKAVYVTDILRIHEQINDFGDSAAAITRFMNAVEHLLLASLVHMLSRQQPETLADMAFVVDGPLAIFGQPAKLHGRLMRFYHNIDEELRRHGLQGPLVMGLQKTGQVMDHALMVCDHLQPDTFRVVDDDYRGLFIQGYKEGMDNFGHETYFGQDFLYKTPSGRIFVFALPYPFVDKRDRSSFATQKAELHRYGNTLPKALDIIRYFECDLYENAVVPVALAHRHASISLVPGGKVLDLISKTGLRKGI